MNKFKIGTTYKRIYKNNYGLRLRISIDIIIGINNEYYNYPRISYFI